MSLTVQLSSYLHVSSLEDLSGIDRGWTLLKFFVITGIPSFGHLMERTLSSWESQATHIACLRFQTFSRFGPHVVIPRRSVGLQAFRAVMQAFRAVMSFCPSLTS